MKVFLFFPHERLRLLRQGVSQMIQHDTCYTNRIFLLSYVMTKKYQQKNSEAQERRTGLIKDRVSQVSTKPQLLIGLFCLVITEVKLNVVVVLIVRTFYSNT